jgi:hypothetical protein
MSESLLLHYTSTFLNMFSDLSTSNILYSYDAAEDNEITFREGDVITEIEPASEDWWQGKNSVGEVGLFPGE